MRLGLMQPYFFPYLGHFSLIAATDLWIVFDVTQYTPQSWMNRNRILHPEDGWKWLTLPVRKGPMHMRTQEAHLVDPAETRRKTINQLTHYRDAPYYQPVRELIAGVFSDDTSLTRLNARGLRAVCDYIGVPFQAKICSELDLALPPDLGPGGWGREICRVLGADSYVNPIGGKDLFDPATYREAGISLLFLQAEPFYYPTGRFCFEPQMSIIDVLMWNSPAAVRDAVHRLALVPAEEASSLAE